MDYIAITTDDYLEHHGILGQKWGIRRYQNADGSLTEAGKKRQRIKEEDKHDTKDAIKNATKVGAGTALAATGVTGLKMLADTYSYDGSIAKLPFSVLFEGIHNIVDGYDVDESIASIIQTGAAGMMPVTGLALGLAGTAGLVGTGAAIVKRYFKRHSESNTEEK